MSVPRRIAQAVPIWHPSCPAAGTTNGARPIRFWRSAASSSSRDVRSRRCIDARSSADRPSALCGVSATRVDTPCLLAPSSQDNSGLPGKREPAPYPLGVSCGRSRRGLRREEGAVYGYARNKEDLQTRLRRIEGQVRGLQRMVDEDVYCIDILTQVNSATAALKAVGMGLLDAHVRHCVTESIEAGDGEEKVEEL